MLVKPAGQTPLGNEKSWKRGPAVVKLVPVLVNVIVGLVVCATKRYHTSAVVVLLLPHAVAIPAVAVALYNVPAVGIQVASDVISCAFEQRSFNGVCALVTKGSRKKLAQKNNTCKH